MRCTNKQIANAIKMMAETHGEEFIENNSIVMSKNDNGMTYVELKDASPKVQYYLPQAKDLDKEIVFNGKKVLEFLKNLNLRSKKDLQIEIINEDVVFTELSVSKKQTDNANYIVAAESISDLKSTPTLNEELKPIGNVMIEPFLVWTNCLKHIPSNKYMPHSSRCYCIGDNESVVFYYGNDTRLSTFELKSNGCSFGEISFLVNDLKSLKEIANKFLVEEIQIKISNEYLKFQTKSFSYDVKYDRHSRAAGTAYKNVISKFEESNKAELGLTEENIKNLVMLSTKAGKDVLSKKLARFEEMEEKKLSLPKSASNPSEADYWAHQYAEAHADRKRELGPSARELVARLVVKKNGELDLDIVPLKEIKKSNFVELYPEYKKAGFFELGIFTKMLSVFNVPYTMPMKLKRFSGINGDIDAIAIKNELGNSIYILPMCKDSVDLDDDVSEE